MKRAIAGISAAITMATATSAMAASSAKLELNANSPLKAVTEGTTHYILGPAVDGGWTCSDYYREVGGYKVVDSSLLTTGTEFNFKDGTQALAIVKGDINASGKWSISQLVSMAKMMSDANGYTRTQQMAADINEDGRITLADLVQMATKRISGVSPTSAAMATPAPTSAPTPVPTPEATPEPTPSIWDDPEVVAFFEGFDSSWTYQDAEDMGTEKANALVTTWNMYFSDKSPKCLSLVNEDEAHELNMATKDAALALLQWVSYTKKEAFLDKDGQTWLRAYMLDDERELSFQEQNEVMLMCVNNLREREGVHPLRLTPGMMQVALLRATENAHAGGMGHKRPDGSKCFTAARGSFCNENATGSRGNTSWCVLMDYLSWYESPAHRGGMLHDTLYTFGYASVHGKRGWQAIQAAGSDAEVEWVDTLKCPCCLGTSPVIEF